MCLVISSDLRKLKGISRSQAVMYMTYLVISQKRCKIETLLTTDH